MAPVSSAPTSVGQTLAIVSRGAAEHCQLTPNRTCITDGPGDYGPNEDKREKRADHRTSGGTAFDYGPNVEAREVARAKRGQAEVLTQMNWKRDIVKNVRDINLTEINIIVLGGGSIRERASSCQLGFRALSEPTIGATRV